ncbi:hypothetical protein [Mycobacteroides abscessus]|uniref:hypothetical protein n=1 Tax=Mycobacteroides abscessus TaxID=36809 RepID=UPI0005DD088F|nr:hypothetical protein [Mycobacteroides abscessus]CPR70099.1 chromosome partitioning protein [Mycobacteroides abscessus]CPU70431.1 chromosome partitioning protein [Mycobacteroides abscessus]
MVRLVVTDAGQLARIREPLDNAGRMLQSTIRAAAQDLDVLDGDPQRAAKFLARWRRRQGQILRRENELLLVLSEAGASDRALAELMGLNRQTIARRLEKARDEREAAS